MIRYDDHAEFQTARRAIDKPWIEETLRDPDATEIKNGRASFLKCCPEGMLCCASCPSRTIPDLYGLLRRDQTMRVRVDQQADAVYVNLTERAIKDSAEVADGIIVDYDDNGRIVGVEILDASKRTGDPTALTQFNLDLPKAS